MIAKFLPYLRAHRWQVAWALAQVFLVAGAERVADMPQAMLPNYRPCRVVPAGLRQSGTGGVAVLPVQLQYP